ncbi:MAG: OmpA family protein [Prevotella pleuritidis]|jgi:ompA family protein|uniref:OmpA/MotB/Pal peptidoglycan-associating domain protein n=1 Tax=Hoylesella pleuritidis F0068 TaxID=1081904 RepID=U2LIE8_9BACT|nr:OmpA family protein [Hoylesella pleuritidis]ERK04228.1 OmpA/MotB/Pal peptidoglycan-associating domain protein [Hoylesella pleuritidis F0068]MBF1554044.1 OmpA family protein [Hoylesella pleuritidis]
MRKLLIVLAFAGISMSTMAQDADPVQKYSVATNSFWSNWFIQVGADWNAWYSSEEHGLNLNRSPFKKFRSNPGVSVALGKWFTPGIGLRTKLQGIWGKTVTDANNYGNHNSYWVLNEHVLFNVSNMLCGYNPNRVWNFIPFIGGGIGRTMTHNLYATDLSAGILNEFRVCKKVAINFELGWNRLESDIDGIEKTNAHRGWDSHDNNLYAEVGLTFNLGKATWEKTPDVDAIKALSQSQIDALNAQLNDANAENARLKEMLANQKPAEDRTVKEFVTTPISVFFNLDKSVIASQKDLVNVRALAQYAKENNSNLLVTGYADSATGTPKHNQGLSERRANTLADELVKMGISRDNIKTVGKGGVDDLSPISFNRRATVQVTE